jgi:hypothetical protein
VREFDLLWLTPFGAAADRSGRARRLFLGPRDAPAVRRVVEAARRAGVVAWTNRMPAAFLEGHEALIQDPSKLEDEVRGRAALVERLVRDGRPLPCRERWRCRRCALDGWCALAHRAVREARGEIAPRALRLDPADARQVARLLARPGGRGTRLWLRTVAPPEAWHPAVLGRAAQGDPWRLEAPASVLLAALPAVGPRVLLHLRPRAGGEAAPARLFVAPRELVLPLTARLARSSAPPTPRGVARFPRVLALPDGDLAARDGWPFAGGARGAVQAWRRWATGVEGWPPCLAGGLAVRGAPRPLDLGWLDDEGRIDPRALLRTYVAERHRARSFRCARCGAGPGCPGLPVAMARRAGFRVLRPVDRS